MEFIAHRGWWEKHDEQNKIPALKKALMSSKYCGVETDVRVTKDKELVLYHDPLFKGKLISSVLYEELKKENIPRLRDLLTINTSKIILLELKDFEMDLKLLIKELKKYSVSNLYIMSFSTKLITNLRRLTNKYKVGVLNYVLNSTDNYSFDFICLLKGTLSLQVLDIFQKLKIEVIGYGVKNSHDLTYNLKYIVNP